ncbi:MAG: tRNA pseudouridine(55) synthase TruB, partial [Proteobacteria bacterium]|nr:tRNA pseudouridine(55) synthase TruB [Pseudomonadota bacterium]
MHGWIILDKPLGLGSTQAVSAVKRALRTGGYPKLKVGHGGTLDPLASGVLPVAIGEATKLAGRLLDSDKIYEFTIRFGEQTDTLDAEGKIVATSDVLPTTAGIDAVLPRFTGPIEQVPPAFSALKVDGERAYDLARAGEAVALASRKVTVRALDRREGRASTSSARTEFIANSSPVRAELVEALPSSPLDRATLTAYVSKGTYIRSLARDIALALGTVGHVT